MIRIPKGTPSVNRSKLSKDELKHFRTLETQFKQLEMMKQMTTNEEQNLGLQVTAAIRHAIENPMVKTPHEQWLCDMWNAELELERKSIEEHNRAVVKRLKPKSKFF